MPMKLFEKLRTKPEWEDEDSAVRARAVRELSLDDRELLNRIAEDDDDPAVRGEAVRRIDDLAALVSIHASESDPAVRAAACETVRALLLDAEAVNEDDEAEYDEDRTDAAVALLPARDLAALARDARLPEISRAALARLEGDRWLGAVATRAGRLEIAEAALARLVDPDALQAVVLKAEERAIALGAFERLSNDRLDPDLLAVIAKRAKQKAVARRARAMLAELEAARVAEEPPEPEPRAPAAQRIEQVRVAEFDTERAEQAERAAKRRALLAAARQLCEAVEQARGAAAGEQLQRLRGEWAALLQPESEASTPDALAALSERFERAAAGCEQRCREWAEDRAQLERLDALVSELEKVELSDDARTRTRWQKAEQAWRGAVSDLRSRSADPEHRERLAGLERRKADVDARRKAARDATRSDAQRQAQENLERLKRLCGTVEQLAGADAIQLPTAERQLRATRQALDELRASDAAVPLPSRRARTSLVRRLQQGHAALLGRVRELRDFADWQRWANLGVREELCARLEALAELPDDGAVASGYREIVLEWRRTADVPKDRDAPLRARFEKAHERVYPRCQVHMESQAASRTQNLERRTALIEEAERLASSTDWLKTAQRIAELKEQWKTIGPVPHQQQKETWNRFRSACNAFFQRRKEDLAERKQEWARNLERKEALIAGLEALAGSEDGAGVAEQVRQAQAEWKTIGPVQRKRSDALWERFRAACDAAYGRIHAAEHEAMAAKVAVREAICDELEALLPAADGAGDPPAQLAATVRDLRQRWRRAPEVPQAVRRRLSARFGHAINGVVARWPGVFRGSDLDPHRQLRRLEELCTRAETLLGSAAASAQSPAEILAARWRDALASNLMGMRVDETVRRRSTLEEVRQLQAERRKIGQLPGADAQRLAQRFQQACDRLFSTAQSQTG